jgi:hypothetical protein
MDVIAVDELISKEIEWNLCAIEGGGDQQYVYIVLFNQQGII